MRRRFLNRSMLENAAVVSVILVFALLIANVIMFIGSRNRLPPATRLGDLDVSGLTVDEAISATLRSLQQPVTLRYFDQSMELAPAAIGFRLNEPPNSKGWTSCRRSSCAGTTPLRRYRYPTSTPNRNFRACWPSWLRVTTASRARLRPIWPPAR
jgi:hypothetical protein